MKRVGDLTCLEQAKKRKGDDTIIESFLKWCHDNQLTLSQKVKVTREGSCAQIGMVAVENINEGDILFQIPRSLLLSPDTTAIKDLLAKEGSSIVSGSGWVPLLLALMHESTRVDSKWYPYLKIVPDFSELDLPMFWSEKERNRLLQGTGVGEAVIKDLKSIENEFNEIVLPFVKKYSEFFSSKCHDLHFYKQMVSFVMAYSFTEPDKEELDEDLDNDNEQRTPQMVPMADILNHVAKHNAHLDFGETMLTMRAIKHIQNGDEIFNTYGQLSNQQLLHMYGFSEAHPDNHNDTVEVSVYYILDILKEGGQQEEVDAFEERWEYLKKQGAVYDGATVVIGPDGILTDEEFVHIMKCLHSDSSEFEALQENDESWIEDDEDELELTSANLSKLPSSWQKLIVRMLEEKYKEYPNSLEEEERNMRDVDTWSNLTRREQYATYVRFGQLKLLQNIIGILR